jgi:hypothetical protein
MFLQTGIHLSDAGRIQTHHGFQTGLMPRTIIWKNQITLFQHNLGCPVCQMKNNAANWGNFEAKV